MAMGLTCPHCLLGIYVDVQSIALGRDGEADWRVERATCPSCRRFIISLSWSRFRLDGDGALVGIDPPQARLAYPKGVSRSPCPPSVPAEIASDYLEACTVFSDSPKASAALSRRCLQHVLRTVAGVRPGDLANEIQQVLDGNRLPTHLAEAIDAVRNIGNFAAHPLKSQQTGAIIDVEPGEADWNLDVLEQLFDFYFVQPLKLAERREALNAKLKSQGKPPMRGG